jgi:hypothetical protein
MKNRTKFKPFPAIVALLATIAVFLVVSPAEANHVNPIFTPGNPDCGDLLPGSIARADEGGLDETDGGRD